MSAPRPARGRLESALHEMPLKAVPAPSDEAAGAAAESSEARPVREPKPRAVCPLAVCDGGGWIRRASCRPANAANARIRANTPSPIPPAATALKKTNSVMKT